MFSGYSFVCAYVRARVEAFSDQIAVDFFHFFKFLTTDLEYSM